MIDLGGIVDYERTFPHSLIAYPKDADPVEVGVTLHIRHVDCDAATAVKAKGGSEAELYAACVAGWDGDVALDKEPLPYSPENAVKLFKRCHWIHAQTKRVALDISNFTSV